MSFTGRLIYFHDIQSLIIVRIVEHIGQRQQSRFHEVSPAEFNLQW